MNQSLFEVLTKVKKPQFTKGSKRDACTKVLKIQTPKKFTRKKHKGQKRASMGSPSGGLL
jgi:hypothetical protein